MALRCMVCCLLAAGLFGCNGVDSPFKKRLTLAQAEDWLMTSHDPDRQRIGMNMVAASQIGSASGYLAAYRQFVGSDDPMVRAAAVRALGLNAPLSDVPLIVQMLTSGKPTPGRPGGDWSYDQPPMVRWEAARALQRLHAPESAVGGLVNALGRDPDADVRRASAEALGQYPRPEVFAGLVSALMRDRDHAVVVACVESLATLTGQNFGEDGPAWLAWEAKQQNPFADRRAYRHPTFHRNPHFWEFPDWLFPPANRPQLPRGIASNQ